MDRTRVRWGRIASIAIVAAVALVAGRTGAGWMGSAAERGTSGSLVGQVDGTHAGSEATRAYVVRPGDTLWSIARRLVGPGGDPRPVVDRLASANDITGAIIRPGEVLVIGS